MSYSRRQYPHRALIAALAIPVAMFSAAYTAYASEAEETDGLASFIQPSTADRSAAEEASDEASVETVAEADAGVAAVQTAEESLGTETAEASSSTERAETVYYGADGSIADREERAAEADAAPADTATAESGADSGAADVESLLSGTTEVPGAAASGNTETATASDTETSPAAGSTAAETSETAETEETTEAAEAAESEEADEPDAATPVVDDAYNKLFTFTYDSDTKTAQISGTADGYAETSLTVSGNNAVENDGTLYLITGIARYAFKNNSTLTSVTFGSGFTELGTSAFMGASALASVVFDPAASIGASILDGFSTFKNCTALSSVTLPETMEVVPLSLIHI